MATATDARPPDRRTMRRQATIEQIVAAAWALVREQGLAALSLRDLGQRVGMRAQSLYSYFESKHDIYDALFHQGYRECAAALAELGAEIAGAAEGDAAVQRAALHRGAHWYFDFCTSDPVRYQLLFQRTIPGFEPSAASYAVAVEVYEVMRGHMAAFGITDPDALDLWTAVLTGLVDQQLSNDPGGDRWRRLVDRAVDALLADIAPHLLEPPGRRARR